MKKNTMNKNKQEKENTSKITLSLDYNLKPQKCFEPAIENGKKREKLEIKRL